jgi:hypothetical protein
MESLGSSWRLQVKRREGLRFVVVGIAIKVGASLFIPSLSSYSTLSPLSSASKDVAMHHYTLIT